VDLPFGAVLRHDPGQIGGGLPGRPAAPEVTQAVPAEHGDALAIELLAERLVEASPAAVARQKNHQAVTAGARQFDQRHGWLAGGDARDGRGAAQQGVGQDGVGWGCGIALG